MKNLIFILCAAFLLKTSIAAVDCSNRPVFYSGNNYGNTSLIVSNGEIGYASNIAQTINNLPSSSNSKVTVNGACATNLCTGVQIFNGNKDYSQGAQVQINGVLYEAQNCYDPTDTVHCTQTIPPGEYQWADPWITIGACHFSCFTAPTYDPTANYQANDIVQDGTYLYIAQTYVNLAPQGTPSSNYGDGEPWSQLNFCIPEGIQQNYDISNDLSYLVPCYQVEYTVPTLESDFTNCTGKTQYLLVGGYSSAAPTILIDAAYGESSVIFTPTGFNDVIENNGVYWYNNNGYSFGFAPNATILQNIADVIGSDIDENADGSYDTSRLSWHLDTAYEIGGWRLGNQFFLQDGPNPYWKVIYLVY